MTLTTPEQAQKLLDDATRGEDAALAVAEGARELFGCHGHAASLCLITRSPFRSASSSGVTDSAAARALTAGSDAILNGKYQAVDNVRALRP